MRDEPASLKECALAYRSVDHVALRVARLREAEALYQRLFGMAVAFREAPEDGEWQTMPAGTGWDDAEAAGVQLELVFLVRDRLVLALGAGDEVVPAGGVLDHVALRVDPTDLAHLGDQAASLGCEFAARRPDYLFFTDAHGVRWEVQIATDADASPRSTGDQTGRWIDLRRRRIENG
ncbi:MAG: VOC family protein [Chloroflexota bacterium]|nr:VOC family protein [Chloroflexota bacterium]